MMKSKLSFVAIAAIGGFVLLSGHAQACSFSFGGSDNPQALDAPSSDSTLLQADSTNLNKLGIAGAGLLLLAGVFGGGMLLKSRADRKPVLDVDAVPVDDAEAIEPVAAKPFAIVIPPEVLADRAQAEESKSDLTTVR